MVTMAFIEIGFAVTRVSCVPTDMEHTMLDLEGRREGTIWVIPADRTRALLEAMRQRNIPVVHLGVTF